MPEEVPIALELAKKQREIGVAEFFARNRHLLGFDNKRKALMTSIKEAVDNSLDACEEANILPEISVEVIDMQNERFRVIVEDNGPGIVKKQIPHVFARLLYGSKFFKLSQSLVGDEPIIVKINGKIRLIPISELVDPYLSSEGEINANNLDLFVPAFDKQDLTYSFKKVSHLIKHKRRNEIMDITLETGRRVKVTGCHSLFTYNPLSGNVEEVEARKLKKNSYVVAPKCIKLDSWTHEINLLDYLSPEEVGNRWFVYGFKEYQLNQIFSRAERVHKKTDKSRAYYRFTTKEGTIDVLEDSYTYNYLKKGFLPLGLVLKLKVPVDSGSWLQTYFHGKQTKIPLLWSLTPALSRFLGFFVAEGHSDNRQIGFSFSQIEKNFVEEIISTATRLGLSSTIENRLEKNSIKVKCFGGLISTLMQHWCSKGAKNKRVPNFIFSASKDIRQHFLDALYQGDGHMFREINQLALTTTSYQLANEVQYLWLMQGVLSSFESRIFKGLGKRHSQIYKISIYGVDIDNSFVFRSHLTKNKLQKKEFPNTLFSFKRKTGNISRHKGSFLISSGLASYKKTLPIYLRLYDVLKDKQSISDLKRQIPDFNLHHINQLERYGFIKRDCNQILITHKFLRFKEEINKITRFIDSDLCLLRVRDIKIITEGYDYVYDISLPNCENFVGGLGGISLHNSRGQQGIGISASVLYSQLTTGKPAKIISRISKKHDAHYYELRIDTEKNLPDIMKEETIDWNKEHGTRVELELEGSYQGGFQSIDQYLKQTSIVNPHATIIYTNPRAEQLIFAKATNTLPPKPVEIKPHPYGVELGILIEMLNATEVRTLQSFLMNEFSRVGSGTAKEICENAALLPTTKPKDINRDMAEKLLQGINKTKIIAPPTNCISPIGEELLEKGLRKEINAEFYCATTRPPAVYRGNPFIVETGLAYGGQQNHEETINLLRYANRVPLLYQQGACAITKSVINTVWRNYGLNQSKGALPIGPAAIVVSINSVWVPFTSESKEAIAHYPEIIKEIKLALQECGRKLSIFIHKKRNIQIEGAKRSYIETYIPHVAEALKELVNYKKEDEEKIKKLLKEILEKKRGKLEKIEVENPDYDEDFAKIGSEDVEDEEREKQKTLNEVEENKNEE